MNEKAVVKILEAIDAVRRAVVPVHVLKRNEG